MKRVVFQSCGPEQENGRSSKGNQLKWSDGKWWYKADYMGYEGLAEVVASQMLSHSTVPNVVAYEPVEIEFHGERLMGCRSRNFLHPEEELITLEHLFRMHTGMGLSGMLGKISSVKERIRFLAEQVTVYTGLEEFGRYLAGMLEVDAFFLNEDRHTNNMAVIYHTRTGDFRLCPYFDMGLSLFADLREAFPPEMGAEECRKRIWAKPFSRDFDEQMDAANELYGSCLRFQEKGSILLEELKRMDVFGKGCYEERVLLRVEETLRQQMRKYAYMFRVTR